jgi:hypothetical protein
MENGNSGGNQMFFSNGGNGMFSEKSLGNSQISEHLDICSVSH